MVGTKEQWTRFADGDSRFKEGMERLYDLFQKAPTLGSLIDPRTVADDLFTLGFDALKGTLDRAPKKTETKGRSRPLGRRRRGPGHRAGGLVHDAEINTCRHQRAVSGSWQAG